jgi:hypothetical protein
MLWKIMRPRWWLVRRQLAGLSGRRRLIVPAAGLLALAGVGWLFNRLVGWLAGSAGDAALLAFVPSALSGMLFFALLQLGDILHQFYLAPDLNYLQSAPVGRGHLFAARMLTSLPIMALPAGAAALVLAALGAAQGASFAYYPAALGLILGLACLATALGVALVIGIASLIPPVRLRRWLPAALTLGSLASLLLHQAAFSRLAGWEPLARLLGGAVVGPGRLALAALAGWVAALVVLGVDWVLFATVHARTADSLGTIVAAPRTARRAPLAARAAKALAGPFPTAQRPIVLKDWLSLLREPQQLINLWIVPLLMAVLLLPWLMSNRESGGGLSVLSFWLLLIYATLFGLNASQGAALPAFMLEGRRLMLLRQAGAAMRTVLWAKFWAGYLPTLLAWAVVLAAYGLFLGLSLWQIGWLVLTVAAGLSGGCAIMLAAGALTADFSVTVPRPKGAGQMSGWSWLGLLLGAVWEGACLALSAWVLLAIGGDTPLVKTTRTVLGAMPPVGQLLDPTEWRLPVGALLALTGVVLAIAWLWRMARRRLETWEPAAASYS